jgi:hypothetical protein
MKKEKNFGCKVHHQVFFSKKAMELHLREKCHPENIVPLKGEDLLGRFSYNIISEAINASKLSEKQKESARQAYFW